MRSRRSSVPNHLPLAAALLGALATVPGCADEGPGSLVIPVQLGNNKSCEEVGVTQIRAFLGDDDDAETTDCAAGEVRLTDVAAGTYELTVQGLASDGTAVMDNLDNDARTVEVIGDGAVSTIDPVLLTDAPARLLVGWDFGLSNCASADIAKFRITAFETGGTSQLVESTIDCEAPTDAGNLHLVPDPDRALKGNVVGEAEVAPVDSAGNVVGNSVSFMFDPPGPGRAVELIVDCDGSGCQAP